MKIKTVLSELKANVSPYMIFWEEWTENENCNLTRDEIETINTHIKNDFEISLLEQLRSNDKIEALEKISIKLNIAQRVFKEWVIVKFLFTIIEMAKKYGYDSFLNTPVSQLNVPNEIKEKLKLFKVYTVQQLFIIYKAEDFGRTWLYNNITDFLITIKDRNSLVLNS